MAIEFDREVGHPSGKCIDCYNVILKPSIKVPIANGGYELEYKCNRCNSIFRKVYEENEIESFLSIRIIVEK